MSGRQEHTCQWCARPLRKIIGMSIHLSARRAYTVCDACDSGIGWTMSEKLDFDKHIPHGE